MRHLALLALAACHAGAARPVVIDRCSPRAGHLMVRDAKHAVPGPDQPIDLDRPPFITRGLGPDGKPVRYYNFDIQPTRPATLYRFTRAGRREPLDVVDVIPGEPGYSDFFRIAWVEVDAAFVPGSITSAAQLRGLRITPSGDAIDCPIEPRGTTAREAHGVAPAQPHELAYRGARVTCLLFGPPLSLDGDRVPTSPIYVTFRSEARPESGFRTEGATPQTHNVVMSLPGDLDYSPLWDVHIYARAAFEAVRDANTALAAPLAAHGPLVNCPIQSIGP